MKRRKAYGSIISVVATSAPLLPHQLSRVAKRSALGIGRAGSYAAHGSGEIVVAFSTGNVIPREDPRESRSKLATVTFLLDTALDGLYGAACDATEEAILNALCMSPGQDGIDGRFSPPALGDSAVGEDRDWLRRRTGSPAAVGLGRLWPGILFTPTRGATGGPVCTPCASTGLPRWPGSSAFAFPAPKGPAHLLRSATNGCARWAPRR